MRGKGAGLSSANSIARIKTADRNLIADYVNAEPKFSGQIPGQLGRMRGGRKKRRRQRGRGAIVDKYGAYLPVPYDI